MAGRLARVAACGLLVGALAGCSGSAQESAGDSAGKPGGEPPVGAQPPGGRTAADVLGARQPAGADRQVVHTGDLVVRVADATKARNEVLALTRSAGGFVFAEDVDGEGESALTLKVPAAGFEKLTDRLARLGKVLRRTSKAEDVTAEVVDVDGRLETAQASAARLRRLIERAGTPAEIVKVEGALAERETEIERLQGRLRVLRDQVALSTVTVRLTERDELEVTDDLPGFATAFRQGTVALVNVLLVVTVALGFLLPFVPVVALSVWLWRRHRRGHTRAPEPAS